MILTVCHPNYYTYGCERAIKIENKDLVNPDIDAIISLATSNGAIFTMAQIGLTILIEMPDETIMHQQLVPLHAFLSVLLKKKEDLGL